MANSELIIFAISFDLNSYSFAISGSAIAPLFLLIFAIPSVWKFFSSKKIIKEEKVEFRFAGQTYSYVICNNTVNKEIAFRIYIELITRKAAIIFDDDNDIISEVYDSWYKLFGVIREDLKRVDCINDKSYDTKSLINLTADILNLALRPHLTRFQGRFRKWLKSQNDDNSSPQMIQKMYPEYRILVDDLKIVNNTLIKYAGLLKKIVYS